MAWVVKVVARVRRPGQSAAQMRDRLLTAEGTLSAAMTAALLPLEPGATVAWSMRAESVAQNEFECYPKLLLTLPRWPDGTRPIPPEVYAALRACRDALIARLTQLAGQFNWTVLAITSDQYGGG